MRKTKLFLPIRRIYLYKLLPSPTTLALVSNMLPSITQTSFVQATVDEVLPQFGLAYLVDHQDGQWTITRQTPGLGLDGLIQGNRFT